MPRNKTRGTSVSPKKSHAPARANEISEKLMENPDLASLISELSASTDDASELVKGLLQASINAGLQTETDAHLGYTFIYKCAQIYWFQDSTNNQGKRRKVRPWPMPPPALTSHPFSLLSCLRTLI